MPDDDTTIGEIGRRMTTMEASIGRRMDAMESRMDKGFSGVERSFEGLRFVQVDLYHTEQKSLESRLATLEDRSKWVTRSLGGIVLGMTASAIVAFIAANGGAL